MKKPHRICGALEEGHTGKDGVAYPVRRVPFNSFEITPIDICKKNRNQ